MSELMNWLHRAGVDPMRVVWVAVAVGVVLALWAVWRLLDAATTLRERLAEQDARLQLLEAIARSNQVTLLQHELRGDERQLPKDARQLPQVEGIHDEITRVGPPSKTSITQLFNEVGKLAEENFEDARTEVVEPGTHVLGARGKRISFGRG
jgi:hypothetical protein